VTILDRDNWELRRKMDKMNESYLEEVEALKLTHLEEVEKLRGEYEAALGQVANLQKKVEEFENEIERKTLVRSAEKDSGICMGSGNEVADMDKTATDDCEYESIIASSDDEEEEEEDEEDEEEEENIIPTTTLKVEEKVEHHTSDASSTGSSGGRTTSTSSDTDHDTSE